MGETSCWKYDLDKWLLQAALVEMNDSALTIDQLDALSRAVPDDQERKEIRLYLQVNSCNLVAA